MTTEPVSVGPSGAPSFTVYWRPGCGFCTLLFRQLDRHGLDPVVVNIWEDDAGRRWLDDAIGSQTVPTVTVGTKIMVNPSIDEVLAALGDEGGTDAGHGGSATGSR